MVEVSRHNFEAVFPQFEEELKKCSYVSVDCEFSNLPSDNFENSLFDDGKERYSKIIENLQGTVVLQVGLTIFTYKRDLNKYHASLYRFHIIPRPFGPLQKLLLFKSTNIQFLCRNKFDFNKCFYDGISFLNETEETLIRNLLNSGNLINSINNALDFQDTEYANTHGAAISYWLSNSSASGIYEIPVESNDISYRYFIHIEIRRRFANVWTFDSDDNSKILVKHISAEERNKYESNINEPVNIENIIKSLLGFTRIFKLLIKFKKPLVGHNLLYDILIMYNQFYRTLPSSYNNFKSTLNELFPLVYDTKVMTFEIQKLLKKVLVFETSLGNLYSFFQDRDGLVHYPHISLNSGIYSKDEQRLHDAGWDSYFTGFCFIKLAYYLKDFQSCKSVLPHVFTFKECMCSVSFLANKIHLARARIPYLNLNESDPESNRPPVLFVRWKNGLSFNSSEVHKLFLKYGLTHKRKCSNSSMLLIASNKKSYNDILRDYEHHKDIRVERYSFFRHVVGFKMVLCIGGILLPVGWTLWHNRKTWISWTHP